MPCDQGGWGLFNVEEFLSGQQAGWILKAKKSSRDNWRCQLRSMCYGNVLCAGPDLFSASHNPILYGIAKSFACFRNHHDLLHSNFTQALVINNSIFTRGPRDKNTLNYSYLELDETAHCRISQLKARDFFNVNRLKTKLELLIEFGLNLTITGYARLCQCLNHYVRRLKPNNRNNGSSRDLCTEFLPLKNPGKKMRSWYTKKTRDGFKINKSKFFGTFHTLTQVILPPDKILNSRISLWNTNGLTNRARTFLFKFYNNLLGLNTRLSHFVANQSRNCTFCSGTVNPVPDETFLHLFIDCPVSMSWQNQFLSKYIIVPNNLTRNQRLQLLLFGIIPNTDKDNTFVAISILLFQLSIWEEKLREKKPSFTTIENFYLGTIIALTQCNKNIRTSAELIDIPLCRIVRANHQDRPRILANAQPPRPRPP